jgi:preprotein translocase subunit SecA
VALDDDIMKRFGGERIKSVMSWVGLDADTPIENGMVSKTIENSQIKVEGFHFDIRKHLVEYDDVVNKHREVIYAERKKVICGADLKANILGIVESEIKDNVAEYIGNRTNDEWNLAGLIADTNIIFPLPKDVTAETLAILDPKTIETKLIELARAAYDQKEKEMGSTDMRLLERLVMLRVIDTLWVEHLTEMENKRQQASLDTLKQMKAVDSYKQIGYSQFQLLLDTIRNEVAHTIYHVSIKRQEDTKVSTPISRRAAADAGNKPVKVAPRVNGNKVGRNDPCPCGSGKKYKHCCGK